jgi:hypothetical protein
MDERETTGQVHDGARDEARDEGDGRRTMARRDVLRGATAVGLAATAAGRLSTVGHAQDATPAASPEGGTGGHP